MAREVLLSCDGCGKKQAGKITILSMEGRRSDGRMLTVDLCTTCWGRVEKEYGVRELVRVPRKGFKVLDSEAEIPT